MCSFIHHHLITKLYKKHSSSYAHVSSFSCSVRRINLQLFKDFKEASKFQHILSLCSRNNKLCICFVFVYQKVSNCHYVKCICDRLCEGLKINVVLKWKVSSFVQLLYNDRGLEKKKLHYPSMKTSRRQLRIIFFST